MSFKRKIAAACFLLLAVGSAVLTVICIKRGTQPPQDTVVETLLSGSQGYFVPFEKRDSDDLPTFFCTDGTDAIAVASSEEFLARDIDTVWFCKAGLVVVVWGLDQGSGEVVKYTIYSRVKSWFNEVKVVEAKDKSIIVSYGKDLVNLFFTSCLPAGLCLVFLAAGFFLVLFKEPSFVTSDW